MGPLAWPHPPRQAPGCPERVPGDFLAWLWRFPHEGKHRLLIALATTGADERTTRLRSSREISRLTARRNGCR